MDSPPPATASGSGGGPPPAPVSPPQGPASSFGPKLTTLKLSQLSTQSSISERNHGTAASPPREKFLVKPPNTTNTTLSMGSGTASSGATIVKLKDPTIVDDIAMELYLDPEEVHEKLKESASLVIQNSNSPSGSLSESGSKNLLQRDAVQRSLDEDRITPVALVVDENAVHRKKSASWRRRREAKAAREARREEDTPSETSSLLNSLGHMPSDEVLNRPAASDHHRTPVNSSTALIEPKALSFTSKSQGSSSHGGGSKPHLASGTFIGALKEAKKKKKNVQWAKNTVHSVVVYEKDGDFFIDVEFKRNKLGWILAVVMIVLHVMWDVGFRYVETAEVEAHEMACSLITAAWYEAILYLGFVLVMLFHGSLEPYHFGILLEWSPSWRLCLLNCFLVGHELLKFTSQDLDSQYSPFVGPALHCAAIWVLLVRYLRGAATFWQEWASSILLLFGSALAAAPMFQAHTGSEWTFLANVVLLAAGFAFSMTLLLLERSRSLTESILVQYAWKNIIGGIVFPIFMSQTASVSCDWDLVFHPKAVGAAALIAMVSVLYYLLLFKIAQYLDVLSVCGVFAANAVIAPLMERVIFPGSSYLAPFWNSYYFAGIPFIIIASAIIVIFASVRRQYLHFRRSIPTSDLEVADASVATPLPPTTGGTGEGQFKKEIEQPIAPTEILKKSPRGGSFSGVAGHPLGTGVGGSRTPRAQLHNQSFSNTSFASTRTPRSARGPYKVAIEDLSYTDLRHVAPVSVTNKPPPRPTD
jgi:hypothetical protein